VALHAVDWRSTTLTELARREGFLTRQVDRWMSQLATYRSRELDGVDDVAMWLPHTSPGALMHGDYKLDNLIWSRTHHPRVAAVVDFEMTTVGDPLIDLAWGALIFWPEEGNLDRAGAPGSPTASMRTSASPPPSSPSATRQPPGAYLSDSIGTRRSAPEARDRPRSLVYEISAR